MRISDWSSDVCSSDLTITRHLIELGHRDIGHIRGHPGHMASAERHRGFNDALAEAGLDPDAAPVEQGYFSYKSGLVAAQRLITRPPRPTALFAGNDRTAERRVGKGGARTCISRWCPHH